TWIKAQQDEARPPPKIKTNSEQSAYKAPGMFHGCAGPVRPITALWKPRPNPAGFSGPDEAALLITASNDDRR
ncbi:hypothetical protein, partial [Mesorhizobium sp. B2-1-5]|uniref:hypothetical protein n=1 Tax=Mesorhizobium sp. B2-1-5 TaxID=2589969 RepID=UPI00112A6A70